jgi:hypothetical protein
MWSTALKRGAYLLLFLAIGCFAVVGWVSWLAKRRPQTPAWKSGLAETQYAVHIPFRALLRYSRDKGRLPSSPKGPEYALYELKPYLAEISLYGATHYDPVTHSNIGWPPPRATVAIFDLPNSRARSGPAHWDDAENRLVGGDFDYLNRPAQLDMSAPSYALYAEKAGLTKSGRWVVFCNGAALWVSNNNNLYKSVLGRSWEELAKTEPGPVQQPVGALSDRQHDARYRQYDDLNHFILQYAIDNGSTPYSEKGGDYALYLLKPYLPDADIFDAVYGRLENGAAYYDDEAKRLANGDFSYFNEALPPATNQYQLRDNVVILADKEGVYTAEVGWVLLGSGDICQILRSDWNGENPLGKHLLGRWWEH